MKEYAVYKGDTLLAIGTAEECAEKLNVKKKTIHYYTTNAYHRKIEKRKRGGNHRTAIIIEE